MSSNEDIITMKDVRQEDVLLGKERNYDRLVGMIAFKAMLETRLETYMDKTVSRTEKTNLTVEVFNSVKATGGRFLLRNNKRELTVLDMDDARIKIRDCFRDCIKQVRRRQRPASLLNLIGLDREMFSKKDTYAGILDTVLNDTRVKLFLAKRSVMKNKGSPPTPAAYCAASISPSPPEVKAQETRDTTAAIVEPDVAPDVMPSSDIVVEDSGAISIYCTGSARVAASTLLHKDITGCEVDLRTY